MKKPKRRAKVPAEQKSPAAQRSRPIPFSEDPFTRNLGKSGSWQQRIARRGFFCKAELFTDLPPFGSSARKAVKAVRCSFCELAFLQTSSPPEKSSGMHGDFHPSLIGISLKDFGLNRLAKPGKLIRYRSHTIMVRPLSVADRVYRKNVFAHFMWFCRCFFIIPQAFFCSAFREAYRFEV